MLDGPVDRPVAGSTFLATSNQQPAASCSRAVSAYTIVPRLCNRDGIWPSFKISSSPFVRSRAPRGCRSTVILTLALGIGANASIFSVVSGVLLRPLVNRDESRLIYIRQSAPGNSVENSTFSVPEVIDLKERLKTLTAIGAVLDHHLHDGRPRRAAAGAGRRRRRLLLRRDGAAAGARTPAQRGRRWAERGGRGGADAPLLDDGRQRRPDGARQDDPPRHAHGGDRRRARTVGALSGGNRAHRQRRHQPASPVGDDGDRPRASDDGAVRPARARRRRRGGARRAARGARQHPPGVSGGVPGQGRFPHQRGAAARADHRARAHRAARPACGLGAGLRHRRARTSRT